MPKAANSAGLQALSPSDDPVSTTAQRPCFWWNRSRYLGPAAKPQPWAHSARVKPVAAGLPAAWSKSGTVHEAAVAAAVAAAVSPSGTADKPIGHVATEKTGVAATDSSSVR